MNGSLSAGVNMSAHSKRGILRKSLAVFSVGLGILALLYMWLALSPTDLDRDREKHRSQASVYFARPAAHPPVAEAPSQPRGESEAEALPAVRAWSLREPWMIIDSVPPTAESPRFPPQNDDDLTSALVAFTHRFPPPRGQGVAASETLAGYRPAILRAIKQGEMDHVRELVRAHLLHDLKDPEFFSEKGYLDPVGSSEIRFPREEDFVPEQAHLLLWLNELPEVPDTLFADVDAVLKENIATQEKAEWIEKERLLRIARWAHSTIGNAPADPGTAKYFYFDGTFQEAGKIFLAPLYYKRIDHFCEAWLHGDEKVAFSYLPFLRGHGVAHGFFRIRGTGTIELPAAPEHMRFVFEHHKIREPNRRIEFLRLMNSSIRYWRDHGTWPQATSDLVPQYVDDENFKNTRWIVAEMQWEELTRPAFIRVSPATPYAVYPFPDDGASLNYLATKDEHDEVELFVDWTKRHKGQETK
jgi:hypothetical protein